MCYNRNHRRARKKYTLSPNTGKAKVNWMRTLFSASKGAHLLFTSDWARLFNSIMLLWEDPQSSAQRACYLPSLSRYPFIHLGREEQVRVHFSRTQHAAHTWFELTTLGSWVWSSTTELSVPLILEHSYWIIILQFWIFTRSNTWYSYTLRTRRACCSQSKFRILKICESSARALFLYNCTPNISRSADANVSIA